MHNDDTDYEDYLNSLGVEPEAPGYYDSIRELLFDNKRNFDDYEYFIMREGDYTSITHFIKNYDDVCNIAVDIMNWAEYIEDYEFCQVMLPVLKQTDVKYKKILKLDFDKDYHMSMDEFFNM